MVEANYMVGVQRKTTSIHVPHRMNRLNGVLVLVGLVLPMGQRVSPRAELWAFTGPWDARSDSSLRANAAHLDAAVTGWIGLDSNTAQPILPSPYADTLHLSRGAPKRMALVTSWHGDRFHPSSVRTLAHDDARLARAAGAVASHAASRYSGLVLDFEGLSRSDVPSLVRVVKAFTDSAHARHISPVVVAIPAADTAAYPARQLVAVADDVMPMLYDQHWSTSGPGPISAPDWVRNTLAMRVAEVGASRVVAALPLYGYRWSTKTKAAAEDVTFTEAKRMVAEAGVSLQRDAPSGTLRAVKPGEWEIWVTDAELLATLVREATKLGVRRVALWRIGQEDPAVWRALAP